MKIYKTTLILLFLNIHWPVGASEALITERIRSMELAEKAIVQSAKNCIFGFILKKSSQENEAGS